MNRAALESLGWDQRQRLMLLEAAMIWHGEFSLGRLREAFGIGRTTAGRDFERYQALAPANLRFDVDRDAYRPTDRFEPVLLHGTAREFLQVLRNRGLAGGSPLAVVAEAAAPVDILEPPEREFDVRILQRITAAIRERRWLTVSYQSMSHPEPRSLRIAPHALAHAGRWHARAWSQTHEAYRDFLLSRIDGLPELGEAEAPGNDQDWDWKNFVTVRVGAHPGLSPAQRRVVERDWNMSAGVHERAVRVSMLPYCLRLLNVGADDVERPAASQQIVLLNADELASFDRLGRGRR